MSVWVCLSSFWFIEPFLQVCVFVHLLTSRLRVQYGTVIYFFSRRQSGTQQEINCQISERVTEQNLSEDETEFINETHREQVIKRRKNRRRRRERERESSETSLTNSGLAVMGKDGSSGDEKGMR